jgi:hypothetical protein
MKNTEARMKSAQTGMKNTLGNGMKNPQAGMTNTLGNGMKIPNEKYPRQGNEIP